MALAASRWGPAGAPRAVLCVHGVGQRGRIFEPLAQRLAAAGRAVIAVDLRGHGDSPHDGPLDGDAHVDDLLATLDEYRIDAAIVAGHSFGARLAATLAARHPARIERLVLVEPAFAVGAERARRSVAIERVDWSFATIEGAVAAVVASDAAAGSPRAVVEAYVAGDVVIGPDGRYRFSYSTAAALAAWDEIMSGDPPVAAVPTLLVRAEDSHLDATGPLRRYRAALGDLLGTATVPGGHNALWSAPLKVATAIEAFLAPSRRAPAAASADGALRSP